MSQNQKEALAAYLVANQEKFYRLAFSYVRSQEAALDIVQNAVVKGLEHAESIREMAYIKTWFYRILVNESLSYMKKYGREVPLEPEQMREIPDGSIHQKEQRNIQNTFPQHRSDERFFYFPHGLELDNHWIAQGHHRHCCNHSPQKSSTV